MILITYGTDIWWISDITTNVPFINSFIRDFAMWMLVQTIVVFSLSLNFDEMYIVKTKEISDDELYEQIREEINNNK